MAAQTRYESAATYSARAEFSGFAAQPERVDLRKHWSHQMGLSRCVTSDHLCFESSWSWLHNGFRNREGDRSHAIISLHPEAVRQPVRAGPQYVSVQHRWCWCSPVSLITKKLEWPLTADPLLMRTNQKRTIQQRQTDSPVCLRAYSP